MGNKANDPTGKKTSEKTSSEPNKGLDQGHDRGTMDTDADDGRSQDSQTNSGDSEMKTDAKEVSVPGFFKKTPKGQEVFQVEESFLNFGGNKVEVGTTINAEDDETLDSLDRSFSVAAIGKPFHVGNSMKGKKFVYLYLDEPKTTPSSVSIQPSIAETEGAMHQLEEDAIKSGQFPPQDNDDDHPKRKEG